MDTRKIKQIVRDAKIYPIPYYHHKHYSRTSKYHYSEHHKWFIKDMEINLGRTIYNQHESQILVTYRKLICKSTKIGFEQILLNAYIIQKSEQNQSQEIKNMIKKEKYGQNTFNLDDQMQKQYQQFYGNLNNYPFEIHTMPEIMEFLWQNQKITHLLAKFLRLSIRNDDDRFYFEIAEINHQKNEFIQLLMGIRIDNQIIKLPSYKRRSKKIMTKTEWMRKLQTTKSIFESFWI